MRAGEVVFRPRPMGDGAKKAGCAASDVPARGGDGPPSCEGRGGGFCEKKLRFILLAAPAYPVRSGISGAVGVDCVARARGW